jgi:hypothetical protein
MITQNRDDLGKLRAETLRKVWHTRGNPPYGKADFHPLFSDFSVTGYRGYITSMDDCGAGPR